MHQAITNKQEQLAQVSQNQNNFTTIKQQWIDMPTQN
jgi:hypothetical protein